MSMTRKERKRLKKLIPLKDQELFPDDVLQVVADRCRAEDGTIDYEFASGFIPFVTACVRPLEEDGLWP